MKCLARYIVQSLTLLSLMLFVAIVALGMRSYSRCEFLVRASERGSVELSVFTNRGRLGIERSWIDGMHERLDDGWYFITLHQPHGEASSIRFIASPWLPPGIAAWRESENRGSSGVLLSSRLLAVTTAVLPALSLFMRLRRRRELPSESCHHCGYDLRATPDRCPECGTIPKKAKE